jgi:hypothetical protein
MSKRGKLYKKDFSSKNDFLNLFSKMIQNYIESKPEYAEVCKTYIKKQMIKFFNNDSGREHLERKECLECLECFKKQCCKKCQTPVTAFVLNINNTLFVDEQYGDDTTAERENESKPWKTINAALLSASLLPGDTIYVQPGNYICPLLNMLDNVNFYFTKGTFISSDNLNKFIFFAANVTSSIRGYGVFNSNVTLIRADNCNIIFEAESISVHSVAAAIVITASSINVNVCNVTTEFGAALNVSESETVNSINSLVVWNSQTIKGSGTLIYIHGSATGSANIQSQLLEGFDNINMSLNPFDNVLISNESLSFSLQVRGQELKTTNNFQGVNMSGGMNEIEFQKVVTGGLLINVQAYSFNSLTFTADIVTANLLPGTRLIYNDGTLSNINIKILEIVPGIGTNTPDFPLIDYQPTSFGFFIYNGSIIRNQIDNTILFNMANSGAAIINVDYMNNVGNGQTTIVSSGTTIVKSLIISSEGINNNNAIRVDNGETRLDVDQISVTGTGIGILINNSGSMQGTITKLSSVYGAAIRSLSQGNVELIFNSISTNADRDVFADVCIDFGGPGDGRMMGNTINGNFCTTVINVKGPSVVEPPRNRNSSELSLRVGDIFSNDCDQAIHVWCPGTGGMNLDFMTLRVNHSKRGAIVCENNSVVDIRGESVDVNVGLDPETYDSTYGAITVKNTCHVHADFGEVNSRGPVLYVDNATNYVWYKADSSTNISQNIPDKLTNGTSVIYLIMPNSEDEVVCTVGGYMKTISGRYCIEYESKSEDKQLRILNSIFVSSDLAIFTPAGETKKNITLAHSIGNTNQNGNTDIITHPDVSLVYLYDPAVF